VLPCEHAYLTSKVPTIELDTLIGSKCRTLDLYIGNGDTISGDVVLVDLFVGALAALKALQDA
jgi:hypothetical protein